SESSAREEGHVLVAPAGKSGKGFCWPHRLGPNRLRVTWDVDIASAFHAEDVSRRLMWAVFDHGDSQVSLYLMRQPSPLPQSYDPAGPCPPPAAPPGASPGQPAAAAAAATTTVGGTAAEGLELSWQVVVQGLSGQEASRCSPAYEGAVGPYCYTAPTAYLAPSPGQPPRTPSPHSPPTSPPHPHASPPTKPCHTDGSPLVGSGLSDGHASPTGDGSHGASSSRSSSNAWGLQGLLSADQLDTLVVHQVLRVALTLDCPPAWGLGCPAAAPATSLSQEAASAPPLEPGQAAVGVAAAPTTQPQSAGQAQPGSLAPGQLAGQQPQQQQQVPQEAVQSSSSGLPVQVLSAGGQADKLREQQLMHGAAAPATAAPAMPTKLACAEAGLLATATTTAAHPVQAPTATDVAAGLSRLQLGQQPALTLPTPCPSPGGVLRGAGQPPLRVLLASLSPRILLVDNWLPPELCLALMQLADPRLVRSRVSTGTETPSRTSRGTFFTGDSARHPLVVEVEQRIQDLVNHPAVIGGKKALVKSEALQVVSYGLNDFYTEHYDNKAGGIVTRSATIIVYLCDCQEGGSTFFPRAAAMPSELDVAVTASPAQLAQHSSMLHEDPSVARPGIRISAVAGRALIFWWAEAATVAAGAERSALPDGTEDLASLHAAEKVVQGNKWIATRWFKEVA
ncbi:hypothetical protein QJQ45_019722, partial [Haematococcus lacustris]